MGTAFFVKKAVSNKMGGAASKQNLEKEASDVKAQLKLLNVMAKKQEAIYMEKLVGYYARDEEYAKYQVVGGRLINHTSFISCTTKDTPGGITEGITATMNGLFGVIGNAITGDDDNKENGQNIMTGLTSYKFIYLQK